MKSDSSLFFPGAKTGHLAVGRGGETLWRGKGCSACRDTGYSGFAGVYEVLVVDDEARRLVAKMAGADELRESARKGGMKSLASQGTSKVLAGVTTVEEFTRVVL